MSALIGSQTGAAPGVCLTGGSAMDCLNPGVPPSPALPTPGASSTGVVETVDQLGGMLTLLPWVAVGVLAIACAVLGLLLLRSLRRAGAAITSAGKETHQAVDLDALVRELITLADLTSSPALVAQVGRALGRLDTTRVEAVRGAAFDPERFTVVDTETTADPSLHHRVAGELRPGWRRGTALLRPADVRVWVPA